MAVLVLATLVAPAAAATWRVHGSFEPDTPQDVSGGFMFAEPDTTPVSPDSPGQVYFNAFLGIGYWSGLNPNVAAMESRLIVDGFQFPMAFLGVWKDCNDDGYIGTAEDVVSEYRSEVLLDQTICPVGTEHNDGQWVYEFRWIAPGTVDEEIWHVPHMINDTESYVWGDTGLADPQSSATGGCFVNPQTGTFSSTGDMLSYADCFTGHTVAETFDCMVLGGSYAVAGDEVACPGVDENDEHNLAFHNTDDPGCSDSVLNVKTHVWASNPRCPSSQNGLYERHDADPDKGTEARRQPAFTVWDCSEPEGTADVRDPTAPKDQRGALSQVHVGDTWVNLTDERGSYFTVPRASPNTNPGGTSYYDALNHTMNGTDHCDDEEETAESGRNRALSDNAPYVNPEADVAADSSAKRETRFPFYWDSYFLSWNWRTGCRPDATTEDPNDDICDTTGIDPPLGDNAPQLGGVGFFRGFPSGLFGPSYFSPIGSTNSAPLADFNLETRNVEFQGPRYYTWYASVGDATLSAGFKVPGASGVYGSEYCGTAIGPGQPVAQPSGFDCDPTHWWDESFGASKDRTQDTNDDGERSYTRRVGDTYNLRDIDCYDGTLSAFTGRGVGLGLTPLRPEGPCPELS